MARPSNESRFIMYRHNIIFIITQTAIKSECEANSDTIAMILDYAA